MVEVLTRNNSIGCDTIEINLLVVVVIVILVVLVLIFIASKIGFRWEIAKKKVYIKNPEIHSWGHGNHIFFVHFGFRNFSASKVQKKSVFLLYFPTVQLVQNPTSMIPSRSYRARIREFYLILFNLIWLRISALTSTSSWKLR